VLAAGRSRRFGRTRDNKLLASLGTRTVITQVLASVAASGLRPIVIVTGHQHRRVERAIRGVRGPRCLHRFNRHHRSGMASSLQAGLRALPEAMDGVVVCLGDMPGINADIIRELASAYRSGDDAVIPVCGKKRGNPVLLGRALFPAINGLGGDQGARALLRGSSRLRFIDAEAEVLRDIDTRRDWRTAKHRRRP
jgi:molybdenum cofactor cytidylyltransferase